MPDVVRERVMWTGEIGCPACKASWRVRDGVLELAPGTGTSVAIERANDDRRGDAADHAAPDERAEAMRTAALLHLASPGGVVLLAGVHALHAAALATLVPDVLVLTLNAPAHVPVVHGQLRAQAPLPLGVGTLRGARLDDAHASPDWLVSVHRAVTREGRVVAPTRTALPQGAQELARDESEWVAEVRVAASGLVPLRRGGDPLTR